MEYKYPSDLYELISVNWNKKRWSKQVIPDLPEREVTEELLDVVYHASFLTEEARKLWIRIIYIAPDEVIRKYSNNPLSKLTFDKPLAFTPGDLIKLAPATNPRQSLIGVYKNLRNGKLEIWGLIDSGLSFWNLERNESNSGYVPPNGFTVSSKSPGELRISREGWLILALKNGRTTTPTSLILYKGPIYDFLKRSSKDLTREVKKGLESKKRVGEDQEDIENYFLRFIERVLNRIREMHHGGILIIVPDSMTKNDSRLTDRINIKYPSEYNEAWIALIEEGIRLNNYYHLFDKLWEEENIKNSDFQKLIRLEPDDTGDDKISNSIGVISTLSGVDGAVVITDKLRLLGFGGEITASSPSLTEAKVIIDPLTGEFEYRSLEKYGTRHRSAMRFCSSFENSIAFIISQDGDIRATKRVGADVYLWPELHIGGTSF